MEEVNKTKDEIDFIEVAQKLWVGRKLIIRVTLAFALIGFIIIIFTPNYYTASCTMVPQTGEKSGVGGLSGLVSMAGINIGSFSSGEVLSPTVYPKILNNINFQKELLYSEYNFARADKPISYFKYATNKKYSSFNLLETLKKYSMGLPSLIIGNFENANKDQTAINNSDINNLVYSLSYKEHRIIKDMIDNLSLNLNNKDGYITLSYKCGEPKVSAEVVLKAQQLLQKYITDFKLEKVRSNLEFVVRSYDEAKENFETKQAELARFRDANKSLTSAIAKTQEEKLTSEYNLLLSVYTELAKQKEQAKIAVTETTPILTIVEPVKIPVEKSGPKRSVMLAGFTFFGVMTGMGWILVRFIIKTGIEKINN
jgi:uncharacterized protein involved in exopolysaccharide biosynthesis